MKQYIALFLCTSFLVACGGGTKTENDSYYEQFDFNANLTAEQKAIADELVKAYKASEDCGIENMSKIYNGENVCKTETENYLQISKKACDAGVFSDCKTNYQE